MPPTNPSALLDGGYQAEAPCATAANATPAATLPTKVDGVPCGKSGENCIQSQCCSQPGFQCFMKDSGYATCRASCKPGVDANDLKLGKPATPWSCTKLGTAAEIPEGPGQCAWAGENFMTLKCCNDANMKCYKQDEGFAGRQFNKPDDWDGTKLGVYRGWTQKAKPAQGAEPVSGTTLFCVAVQFPKNPRVDEAALISQSRDNKWSIFGCDEHQVLDGAKAKRAKGWASVVNTDVFIKVWSQVVTA